MIIVENEHGVYVCTIVDNYSLDIMLRFAEIVTF